MSEPTLRDVFAAAGFDYPADAILVCATERDWFIRKPCGSQLRLMYGEWMVKPSQSFTPIDLSNLPARDAWGALPDYITEHPAVEELMSVRAVL